MEMTNELTSRIEALEKRVETLEAALKDYQQNVGDGKKNTPHVIGLTDSFRKKFYLHTKDGKLIWDKEEENSALEYEDDFNDCKSAILSGKAFEEFYCPFVYKYFYTPELAKLSDGKILKVETKIGDTLREVEAFANLIGYEYDPKVKKDKLVGELINKYGSNGWVLSNGQLMSSTGQVFRVSPCDINDILTKLRDPDVQANLDIPETFAFAPNATDVEKLDIILNVAKNAKSKFEDDWQCYADEFQKDYDAYRAKNKK